MDSSSNGDWEIIRQEMEIEANSRRFERRMKGMNAFNNIFLSCFPKEKRNKIAGIETLIFGLPLIALFLFVIIKSGIIATIISLPVIAVLLLVIYQNIFHC